LHDGKPSGVAHKETPMRTLDEMLKLVDTVRNDLKLPVTQPIIEAGARHLANDLDIALRALEMACDTLDGVGVTHGIFQSNVTKLVGHYIAQAQGGDDD